MFSCSRHCIPFKQEYKNAADVVDGYMETPQGFGDVVKVVFTIVNSEPTNSMLVSGFKVKYCKEIGKYHNKVLIKLSFSASCSIDSRVQIDLH